MKLEVTFYRSGQGNSPVEKYLDSLDDHEAAPLHAALKDISLHGLEGASVQLRVIKGKLWELKIHQHRVFYVLITGPRMVLLHACKKQSQKARQGDLNLALARMEEVLGA